MATQLEKLDAKVAKLSPQAQRVWASVKSGKWYAAYGKDIPAAMAELEAAGVVVTMGRVVSMQACFVPKGTKPLRMECYPT